MTNTTNKTKQIESKLKELFNNTNFECYQYSGFDTAEELMESLREEIDQDEIIYYSNAIKYLSDNDASLQESIELANELGYSLKDINSELLATLLQQQNLNEELTELIDEIEEIYNS